MDLVQQINGLGIVFSCGSKLKSACRLCKIFWIPRWGVLFVYLSLKMVGVKEVLDLRLWSKVCLRENGLFLN